MNLINKGLLNLALLPKALYAKMEVNVDHLKTILTTKLIMDDRRPISIQEARKGSNPKGFKNNSILVMLMSMLIGCAFLLAFFLEGSYTARLTIFFTAYIFMLAMTLVSDFTHVLIDVRDNYILMPKPVNDKTIVVSRLLHILIHLLKIVLPMAIPGAIYLIVVENILAPVIFMVLIMFATLISVFLINAVYIVILKITTPQKFKNIITSIQILFSIIVYASYRMIVDGIDTVDFDNILVFSSNWWILAPPFWFASAFNVLYTGAGSTLEIMAAILAFLIPLASIYIVIKYLAPAFNQKLSMISGSGGPEEKASTGQETIKRSLVDKFASLMTSSKEEKASFLFTWKLMSRSRDFKMKVYPVIGYIAVLAGLAIFKSLMKSGFEFSGPHRFHYIVDIYALGFILTTVLRQINYSEKFEGNWVFYSTPIKKPGHLINGATLAASLKFNLWLVFILLTIGFIVGGTRQLPNLLFAISNIYLVNYMVIYVSKKKFPFSTPVNEVGEALQVSMLLWMFLVGGIVGGVHYFIYDYPIVVAGALLLSALTLALVYKSIKEVTWSQMDV